MTIIRHGNETSAWQLFGTENAVNNSGTGIAHDTSSSTFDSSFSRASIHVDESFFGTPLAAGTAEVWAHGRITAPVSTQSDDPIVLFRDQAGAAFAGIGSNNGLLFIGVASAPGGALSNVADSVFGDLPSNTTTEIDVRLVLNGAGSLIQLFVNRSLAAEYNGSVAGLSEARQVVFGDLTGGSNDSNWSELIVATSSTIGLRVATLEHTGNGDLAEFTGSIANVFSLSPGLSGISSSTTGEQHSFNLADTTAAFAGLSPLSVQVSVEARRGAAGGDPQNISTGLRINAANFAQLKVLLNSGLINTFTIFDFTNPSTGLPWTLADLNGLQSYVRSEP